MPKTKSATKKPRKRQIVGNSKKIRENRGPTLDELRYDARTLRKIFESFMIYAKALKNACEISSFQQKPLSPYEFLLKQPHCKRLLAELGLKLSPPKKTT